MNKKTRSGAIFEIVEPDINTLDKLLEGRENQLTLTNLDLFRSIFALAHTDPEYRTDMASLCEYLGTTRAAIVKQLPRLIDKGFFEKDMEPQLGKRSASVYRLLPAHIRAEHVPAAVPADSPQIPLWDDTEEPSYTETISHLAASPSSFKAERLSLFYIFPALASGKKGRRLTEETEVACTANNFKYTVTVRPSANQRAANIYDVRVLVALFSRLVATHGAASVADNPFTIHIGDLCEDIRAPKSTNHKEMILDSMRRWESTGFKITATEYYLQNKKLSAIVTEDFFRMITRLRIVSYGGYLMRTPQAIAIWFDQEVLRRVLRGEGKYLLTLPDSFMDPALPIMIKFKLWLKRSIGTNTDPKTFSFECLRTEIEPWQKLSEFKKSFMGGLSECTFSGTHYDVGGYFVHIVKSSNEVIVSADSRSLIVTRAAHYRLSDGATKNDE